MKNVTSALVLIIYFTQSLAQTPNSHLKISHLTGDFYIYTTAKALDDNPTAIPANGMYLITASGAVMFDTPFDTAQFKPLLDTIKARHNKNIVMCIATHSHDDRTAGLEYYSMQGIKTYTTKQTDEICEKRNNKRAEYLINNDTSFTIGQYEFQTYYPGAGHTPDNIVIWFDKQKILYGGCFVKSTDAKDLGNLADANVPAWEVSVKNLQNHFPKPEFIIPGHFDWTSNKSLSHTLKLIKEYEKKNENVY